MPNRTLWEEGRHPGRLVARAAMIALLLVALAHLALGQPLGVVFDALFVMLCVGAALWVHPRDFFTVGVLPPLLLAVVVVGLVIVDRSLVARADDGAIQAVVSGLAHRALGLATGYGLALGVLGLRQVALRNRGRLRVRREFGAQDAA